MDPDLRIYLAAWLGFCVACAAYAWRARRDLATRYAGYGDSLREPWKLGTFALATASFVIVAPWTGDPTWDWFDALFMSVLTYLSAPWAVGVLFLALSGRAPRLHAPLAACAWMFSASWSYDLYILLRDGVYPVSWAANIAAASVLYASAGLLWNLERHPVRGVIFAFMREGWPRPVGPGTLRAIVWAAAPFVLLVAATVAWFLWEFLRG